MSEDQTSSLIEQLKNSGNDNLLNLELHNIMENPELLKKLNENIQNEKFNNLSIVNASRKQIDLKDITSVLINHIGDLTNLIKHVKGMLHICSFKSQNDQFIQNDLLNIRQKIDQRVPLNLNIIEESPLEENESKIDEKDDDGGVKASKQNLQSMFS